MERERELLVHWAAEEFVAAGRTERPAGRAMHRRRALFFADLFAALDEAPPAPAPAGNDNHDTIGNLLVRAFGAPGARNSSRKK